MNGYKLLRVLGYNSNNNINEELKMRKNKYNSILTDFYINPFFHGESIKESEYELFCNPISDIRILIEEILDNSKNIDKIAEQIPIAARKAVINRIIVNEIQSTNDIEGVKSTKKELRNTLEYVDRGEESEFSRIISTYLNILNSDNIYINKISDIRALYDDLFRGSDSVDEYVEGDLFREEFAYIYINNQKIHCGTKASEINAKMDKLVNLMNRKDIPFLIKAVICHYIIEYIHPFYDGNGRLGRFMLSVYLKRKLDVYSALSVSYSINQNKSKYEKLFLEVSNKSNYGELTHFVLGILELIKDGQNSVKELIETSIMKMENIVNTLDGMVQDGEIDEREFNILFLYAQVYAFNEYEAILDNQVVSTYSEKGDYKKVEVKSIIQKLEDRGYLITKKRRPKIHEISRDIKLRFE